MIKTLDLFCGAGGLTIGFRQAGFETVSAVEIDKTSVETFAAHSPSAEICDTDIRKVDLKKLRHKVDVVIGGPPCQPFSSGGLRQAEADERNMVPEFIRAIKEVSPDAFVMENVPGLTVGARRMYLDKVMQEFLSLGYQVSATVLRAEDYGVPQKRRRLFVVGMRSRRFRFPAPTHGETGTNYPHVTAGNVLTKAPNGIPNDAKVYYAKNADLRPSPYHGLLFNGGGRAINLAEPAPTIISSAGGNKTHFIDTLNVVPEYHAHLMRGGAPLSGPVPGCRRLTARESAIIQSFPEDINFLGPVSAQYRQIGNAVPPLLAQAVADSLRDQINGACSNNTMLPEASVQLSLI